MKTSELTGAALDWAVARCEKLDAYTDIAGDGWGVFVDYSDDYCLVQYQPSKHWGWAGPIIEREKIDLNWDVTLSHRVDGLWFASASGGDDDMTASTPLVAAMRAYVASKFGDEIDVPKELIDEETN